MKRNVAKKFARKGDLIQHKRIHSGVKQVVCGVDNCGQKVWI